VSRRDEKPCQKFNLVVYYNKGIHLAKRYGTQPIFHKNVYIYSDDHNYLYAYDAKKFDVEHEDPVVEMIQRVISTCFKYNGIHVSGLELAMDHKDKGETFWYQLWLITNLSKEELEKEGWYGY